MDYTTLSKEIGTCLNPLQAYIYLGLCLHTDFKSDISNVNQDTLADFLKCDVSTVQRALQVFQEKQMLAILLTVLVEDNQPYVLFMDEPEISLHFEWQKQLISLVLKLNPNIQIIMTTHSPAVVMDGWTDRVTEVNDITIK